MDCELMEALYKIAVNERQFVMKKDNESYEKLYVNKDKMIFSGEHMDISINKGLLDTPPYICDYITMFYTIKGKSVHSINNSDRIILEEKEILIVNKGSVHRTEKLDEEDLLATFIFLPELNQSVLKIAKMYEGFVEHLIIGYLHKFENSKGYLHFRVSEVNVIQNLIENLLYTLCNKSCTDYITYRLIITELVIQLMNNLDKLDMKSVNLAGLLVLKALREIQATCGSANISHLAEEYDISVAYISPLDKIHSIPQVW